MTETNTTIASVVNLNPQTLPYSEIRNLEDSIEALLDYSQLESDQKLLRVVAKACRDDFNKLASKILSDSK